MIDQTNETHEENMRTPVNQIAGAFPNPVTPPDQIAHIPLALPEDHPQQIAYRNHAVRRVLFPKKTTKPTCKSCEPKKPWEWDSDRDFDSDGSACAIGIIVNDAIEYSA